MNKEVLFSVTLKDCEVQTFTAGGPGGQHQNRSQTGVRIIHRDSGAVGESREQRSQLQNKKSAFRKMVEHPRFKFWVAEERKRLETGRTIEDEVAEWMSPENIKVEVKQDGKWVPEND